MEYRNYGGGRIAGTGYVRYTRAKCPACGKEFARSEKSVYGKYCSYTCYRTIDRIERERAKEKFEAHVEACMRMERRTAADKSRRYARESNEKTLKLCREKIRLYKSRMKESRIGTREYRNARDGLAHWRRRMDEAERVRHELKTRG